MIERVAKILARKKKHKQLASYYFKLIHCHHSTLMLENCQLSSLASSLSLSGLVSLDTPENLPFVINTRVSSFGIN
jgi:hypothetical protein